MPNIRTIIKEFIENDLEWIQNTESSFDPEFTFNGKEYWVDVEKLSVEEKFLIRNYILHVVGDKRSRTFREASIYSYKGFIVHCGTDENDYLPDKGVICYLDVSFDDDENTSNTIYVDGRDVLEYIKLVDQNEELDESLEWSDKDNSYSNDEKFSNDTSWKTDDNWTPNPDKSYWKQGSTGGDTSSSDDSVNEGFDDLDWLKDIKETPNYNGFPQGVVYVKNHAEIDMVEEIIGKLNPKKIIETDSWKQSWPHIHNGLEDRRDEVEDEGYDQPPITISFFVEKDYPGGLMCGYWTYEVNQEEIQEWLNYGYTFNKEYRIYNDVHELKKDLSQLIN